MPVVLYSLGYVEKPYIWPWGFLWEQWENDQKSDPDAGTVVTKDGREFSAKFINELRGDGRTMLAEIDRLYDDAVRKYSAFQAGDEGAEPVEPLLLMMRARKMLISISDRLEKVRGLADFKNMNDKSDRLVQDVGLKVANWNRGLNTEQAEEFTRRKKAEGLAEDEEDGSAPDAGGAPPAEAKPEAGTEASDY